MKKQLLTYNKVGKKARSLSGLTIFFLILAMLPLQKVKAQCPLGLLYDGFETGVLNSTTWAPGTSGTWGVTAGAAGVGSFKLEATGTVAGHLTGLYATLAAVTPTYVSWWVNPQSTSASNYVVFGDNAITATNCIAFVYYTAGNIAFVGPTTYNYAVGINTWTKIELKNINYVTHTFDIWVNGSLQQTGFGFRSATQNDISRFHLYAYTASAVSMWDDIRVGSGAVLPIVNTTSLSCFGTANASATVTPNGQIAPLTYSWTGASSTSSVATNLAAGIYTVTVADAVNCVLSQTMAVMQPSAPISSAATKTNVTCFGLNNGKVNGQATGGTAPYTYTWSPGGGNAPMAQNLAPGSYVTLIKDANNCTYSVSNSITEPADLTAVTGQTNVTCLQPFGNSNVTPSGGTMPYSYQWAPWGGTSSGVTNLPSGTHSVIITDANNCQLTKTVAIMANKTVPSVSATTSQTNICKGMSVNLTATGSADTYSWSTGASGANLSVSPTAITIYSVTGTNTTSGCASVTSLVQYVSSCSGIASVGEANAFVNVYPNPNAGEFIVELLDNSKVVIYNALGEMISEQSLTAGKNTIDIHTQNKGIYFVKIIGEQNQQTIRVVKN